MKSVVSFNFPKTRSDFEQIFWTVIFLNLGRHFGRHLREILTYFRALVHRVSSFHDACTKLKNLLTLFLKLFLSVFLIYGLNSISAGKVLARFTDFLCGKDRQFWLKTETLLVRKIDFLLCFASFPLDFSSFFCCFLSSSIWEDVS